jgi:hypothetical protein
MPLSCRFYKQKYPSVEDVVMVNVRSIAEMGAYVHLLEYNNIEGMILLSELSRRRIRSINKLIRVGKTEPVVVIRVDREKGTVLHVTIAMYVCCIILGIEERLQNPYVYCLYSMSFLFYQVTLI